MHFFLSMLSICSWVSPRGECCRFFLCPPGANAVVFSLGVAQGRMLCNLSWPFPGGMLPDFFLDPSLTEGRPFFKLNSRSQAEDIESIIIRSKIPFILSTRRDLKHCCGYPCDISMNSYRLGVPLLLLTLPPEATRPTKQFIVKSKFLKYHASYVSFAI